MKFSELIQHVGDENVAVQNLHESSNAYNWRSKQRAVEVSFLTREIAQSELVAGDFKKVALVIWFDKDRLPFALSGNHTRSLAEAEKQP